MAERPDRIERFLAGAGWPGPARRPLAGDASFRRYERIEEAGRRAVLMDAPPAREDVRPFLAIARHLRAMGYSAPAVLAADEQAGLVLLEDLGEATFNRRLAEDGDERALYRLAVDLLVDLHRRPEAAAIDLPPYDDARLLEEAALLTDWYLPAIRGEPTSARARASYLAAWREALPAARRVPATLVLRDYHVDNLMVLADRPGVAACGLLDFQDGVIGPVTYDLVSLLEDARRDIDPGLVAEMTARYLAAFPRLDREAFAASWAVLGAQRGAKVIGIFTRLWRRDGKPAYLAHVPRVWRLLEGDIAHPALAPVRAWFDRHVPPAERDRPRGSAAP